MKVKFSFILLLVILAFVYWRWWVPGPKVAHDFPFVAKDLLKFNRNLPFVWSENGAEGLGEYSTPFLWSWPFSLTMGFLANFGLSFELLEKYLILLPFLIMGSIGIWKLAESIHLSYFARFISALFYLTNTYILLLIDGGQLLIALSYSWFPVSFLMVLNSITEDTKKKILAGLAISLLGFLDIRFIYILILLVLIRIFFELSYMKEKRILFLTNWIKNGIILGVIFLSTHFYWLYPLFKVPISSKSYQLFTQNFFLSFVKLDHGLLVLAPHWYMNIFGKIAHLEFIFIFIPILVFLAPILRPKNFEVGFWLIVALISIFLTKGTSEPFAQVYLWLFNYVPGFSLFRDSTKFFFLITLSYSILIGISMDEILFRLRAFKKAKFIVLICLFFYLLVLIRPVLFGQMTGTFSSQPLQKEYQSLDDYLRQDNTFGRVFWIPSFPALGYADINHPRIEASRAVEKRVFGVGTKGAYELFNFLREASYMGEIFDVAGISYIAYPYLDLRRDDMHPDNIKYYYTFLDQLTQRSWLSKVNGPSIPLFKTKQHQDRFFITPNVWLVIGSDKLLNESTRSANLRLSKNALIFTEEYPGLAERIDDLPQARIVLNNKKLIDLAASFIDSKSFIFPARQLDFSPNDSGWWKRDAGDLINWRSFLQGKYGIDNQDFDFGGGWAVGEGNKKYQVTNIKYQKNNILLARVMESSRSGSLRFYQDDQLIGQVSTQIDDTSNVRWFEVGSLLRNNSKIEIVSSGDINVINALAILDKHDWAIYKTKSEELQDRIVKFTDNNLINESSPTLSYQKVNPTKYIVNVTNLTRPSFLVFSQTYDKLWKMNNSRALPIYSLLNGFQIDKNGQYIVEFEAQKYITPGLMISGLSLLVLFFLVIKSNKRF